MAPRPNGKPATSEKRLVAFGRRQAVHLLRHCAIKPTTTSLTLHKHNLMKHILARSPSHTNSIDLASLYPLGLKLMSIIIDSQQIIRHLHAAIVLISLIPSSITLLEHRRRLEKIQAARKPNPHVIVLGAMRRLRNGGEIIIAFRREDDLRTHGARAFRIDTLLRVACLPHDGATNTTPSTGKLERVPRNYNLSVHGTESTRPSRFRLGSILAFVLLLALALALTLTLTPTLALTFASAPGFTASETILGNGVLATDRDDGSAVGVSAVHTSELPALAGLLRHP